MPKSTVSRQLRSETAPAHSHQQVRMYLLGAITLCLCRAGKQLSQPAQSAPAVKSSLLLTGGNTRPDGIKSLPTNGGGTEKVWLPKLMHWVHAAHGLGCADRMAS